VSQLLDRLARLRVPHNYFTHFYITSVLSSLFCAWKMGAQMKSWDAVEPLQLAWLLMLLQGMRRLAESYAYTSSSKSTMWFGHWLLGLIFYLTINVSIWAETTLTPTVDSEAAQGSTSIRWRTAVLPPAILACHALQHTYHAYLYRLRTSHSAYQLPSHPLFPNLLCPHYTCETLIYLLLSFLAAPAGRWVNWTLLCASLFVAVNLGVTAEGTKRWYEQRFGVEKVRRRRRMIPWLW
jgi:3-oxo-5-alpha-steroid 4-dehydrogenase 3